MSSHDNRRFQVQNNQGCRAGRRFRFLSRLRVTGPGNAVSFNAAPQRHCAALKATGELAAAVKSLLIEFSKCFMPVRTRLPKAAVAWLNAAATA